MHAHNGFRYHRILAATALALILVAPLGAFAQGGNKLAATFNERYPVEETPTPPASPPPAQAPAPTQTPSPPPAQAPSPPPSQVTSPPASQAPSPAASQAPAVPAEVRKVQNAMAASRVVSAKRPRSRVVVVPRSFLDAGTEVLPGERKFLDYAFPPTHTAMDVVTNTGGRVGWHNSPLPGPFFPRSN
jgi:hypothetical protein